MRKHGSLRSQIWSFLCNFLGLPEVRMYLDSSLLPLKRLHVSSCVYFEVGKPVCVCIRVSVCAVKKLRSCSHDANGCSHLLKKFQEASEKLRYVSSRRKCDFVFIQMVLYLYCRFGLVLCISVFISCRLSFQDIKK